MKNLALIFLLVIALFSDVNAMPSECQTNNSQDSIPVTLYTVRHRPPIEVLVVPSMEKVKLGGIIDREIHIDCKNYKGIPVYSPIYVRYDMSLDEVVDSLCESFRVEGIECREGLVPRDVFLRRFPFFKRKL